LVPRALLRFFADSSIWSAAALATRSEICNLLRRLDSEAGNSRRRVSS
jgi:hypothetical protein